MLLSISLLTSFFFFLLRISIIVTINITKAIPNIAIYTYIESAVYGGSTPPPGLTFNDLASVLAKTYLEHRQKCVKYLGRSC